MASDSERPERTAFRELEQLVRHLADELAGFRRRALQAEARLKETDGGSGNGRSQRSPELERENRQLRAKLKQARERTRDVLERVRFLRQQAQQGGATGGGGGADK